MDQNNVTPNNTTQNNIPQPNGGQPVNQNTDIKKYLNFKNLVYVLAGLQFLFFFLPMMTVKNSVIESLFGASAAGKKPLSPAPAQLMSMLPGVFIAMIPSLLIILIWVLKDIKIMRDDIADLICLIASSFQVNFVLMGTIAVSAFKRLVGLTGGMEMFGAGVSVHAGFGLILSWLTSVGMMVLFIMFTLKKLRPEDGMEKVSKAVDTVKTQAAAAQAAAAQKMAERKAAQEAAAAQKAAEAAAAQAAQTQPQAAPQQAAPVQPQAAPQQTAPAQEQAASQDNAAEFVFCTNCGEKLPAGTKFCTKCGTKVE